MIDAKSDKGGFPIRESQDHPYWMLKTFHTSPYNGSALCGRTAATDDTRNSRISARSAKSSVRLKIHPQLLVCDFKSLSKHTRLSSRAFVARTRRLALALAAAGRCCLGVTDRDASAGVARRSAALDASHTTQHGASMAPRLAVPRSARGFCLEASLLLHAPGPRRLQRGRSHGVAR